MLIGYVAFIDLGLRSLFVVAGILALFGIFMQIVVVALFLDRNRRSPLSTEHKRENAAAGQQQQQTPTS